MAVCLLASSGNAAASFAPSGSYTTNALGHSSTSRYNAAGRQTKSTDPLGGATTTAYTEAGHVASTTAADGSVTSNEYDAAGRRTKTILPGGASRSSAYDAAGQKTSDTDEAGHTTSYAYDAAGRLITTTLPSTAATQYAWNEGGQLLSQTDARGNTTKYGYDLAGRRVSRTIADGSTEQLAYDADGKLTVRQYFDGSKIQYTFDQGGRATGETRPDGQTTIGYDQYGRANSHTDTQRGSVSHTLDAVGRQTNEVTKDAANTFGSAVAATWDKAGQRTAISASFTNEASHRIDAAWDAGGRLQTLAENSSAVTSFTHDQAGRLTSITRANGSTSTYSYSAAGHVTQITHAGSGGNVLAQFNYTRDQKGRLTQATETVGSSTTTKAWEYDADGKLTKETATAQGLSTTCSYQYDAVGNRTQKDCDGTKTTYSYNNLDQLTQETVGSNATTYKYDGRGNLLEKKTPAATITYTWSSDNRLTQVSDGTTTVKYGYDALGRRISRTEERGSNKTETQWILDTARPYSEIITERTRTNGGAWSTTSYTHTPDGVGLLIAENKAGTTRHIYTDAQGSTRLVTDAAGNVIEALDFDAFGNETATNTKETRHRYTGESFDATTGLYHLRARDYDPATGRFISMDEHPGSQRIPLSLNKYLYGNADPVNTIDPSGYMAGVAAAVNTLSSVSLINVAQIAGATALAGGLLCTLQVAVVAAASHLDVDFVLPKQIKEKGCTVNQMRLQLQASKNGVTSYTKGYVMTNHPRIGVTRSQVINKMNAIYLDPPSGFPRSLSSGLNSAIIKVSKKVNSYSPAGEHQQNYNIIKGKIGEDNKKREWRLDLENLRGINLRQ